MSITKQRTLSLGLFAFVLSLFIAGQSAIWGAERVTLPRCLIMKKDKAQVPAREAGVIQSLEIREGDHVKHSQLLGAVDTTELQKQLQLAQVRAAAAAAEAKSTAKLVVAEKTLAVVETELEVSENLRAKGTVTEADHRRQRLLRDRAVGEIAVANLERQVLDFEHQVRKAEVEIVRESIERRKIRSPLAGVVVEIHRRVGEWVQPGDPFLEIVRLDKLVIEGMLPVENTTPESFLGQSATISVKRGNEEMSARGKIVFVSPVVEATGEVRIRAEFDNHQREGAWFFRPGQLASLTFQAKP